MKLIFFETPFFTEQISELIEDEDYRLFQNALLRNPEKGDLIPGGGGLRKIRMALPGRGKSGGARVIYLYLKIHETIYLLYLYRKSSAANLTKGQLEWLRDTDEQIKQGHR